MCVCVCAVKKTNLTLLWPETYIWIMTHFGCKQEALSSTEVFSEKNSEPPVTRSPAWPLARGPKVCMCLCKIKVVPICEAVFLERSGNTPQISANPLMRSL